MLKGKKVGCLGVGNMGRALVQGLVRSEVVLPEDVRIFDRDRSKMLEAIDNEESFSPNASTLIQWADIILLAIKPQDMQATLLNVRELFRRFISLSSNALPLMILNSTLASLLTADGFVTTRRSSSPRSAVNSVLSNATLTLLLREVSLTMYKPLLISLIKILPEGK